MSNSFAWGKNLARTKNTAIRNDENHDLRVVSPSDYISIARKGMGLLQKIKFDRSNNQYLSEQAESIATSLINQQKLSIDHQIMLDLDIEKKKRLRDYQEEIHHVDSSIFKASNSR